eukprot:scaffold15146_cov72-Phaeocystis_antarctica.AAC.7
MLRQPAPPSSRRRRQTCRGEALPADDVEFYSVPRCPRGAWASPVLILPRCSVCPPRSRSAPIFAMATATRSSPRRAAAAEAPAPELTSLQFADSFSDTTVKLFEMDDKVLEELLADGGRRLIVAACHQATTPRQNHPAHNHPAVVWQPRHQGESERGGGAVHGNADLLAPSCRVV